MPRLLAACTLFIGCDSGPKHIAAASGVPTIGIHSGIVDPAEWGPMGERAVALYRDMSCAPCFLAKPEHCPRGLACVEMLDPTLVWQMARRLLGRPVSDVIAPVHSAFPTRNEAIVAAALPGEVAGEAQVEPPPAPPSVAIPIEGKRSGKHPGKAASRTAVKPAIVEQRPEKPAVKQPAKPAVARTDMATKQSSKRAQRSPVAGSK
jgi:hypothetical protein